MNAFDSHSFSWPFLFLSTIEILFSESKQYRDQFRKKGIKIDKMLSKVLLSWLMLQLEGSLETGYKLTTI